MVATVRARCSAPGCDDGRLSDGSDCPHCEGCGTVMLDLGTAGRRRRARLEEATGKG